MFIDPSILNFVEEFLDYHALLNHDIPDNIWEAVKLFENGHQKDVMRGLLKPKLPHLSKIAESVLVVLCSNSIEERGFSSFEKIRLSSDLDSILESHLPYFL